MTQPAATPTLTVPLVTEIPSSLKQLARLVSRGFYLLEDSLIVDMLVRNHCMREDDLAELLKFDKKFLRAKIQGLKNDKIIQVKQRIETDVEGKLCKINCYFINYKIFVNIVKYKLDHMHKKMETSERDATNRSSFKCTGCSKTFTDLEADQLFDPVIGFRCTFCSKPVEEDESAGPKKDSRQLLARFNEQMEKLYELLKAVENINLAPSILEPDPVEIDMKGKPGGPKNPNRPNPGGEGGPWSGDATRNSGLRADEQQVNITFGENSDQKKDAAREMPIWMQQSTVITAEDEDNSMSNFPAAGTMDDEDSNLGTDNNKTFNQQDSDEITSLLLRHEKRNVAQAHIPKDAESDKSDESEDEGKRDVPQPMDDLGGPSNDAEVMSGDDEDDGDIPTVRVGNEEITVTDVNEQIIAKMTTEEKERYNQVFQDFYSHMYD